MRGIALSLLCLIASSALADDTPSLHNFAVKHQILIAQDSPLQVFEVPSEAYRTAIDPSLNDLRVFNGSDSVVPFEKRTQGFSRTEQVVTPLPFFPITAASKGGDEGSELQVSQSSEGKILSVTIKNGQRLPSGITTYLVDLRKITHRIEAFRFQWHLRHRMANVTLATSSDLKQWQPVASGVLADLSYEGQSIRQDKIDSSQALGTFLRVTISEDSISEGSIAQDTVAKDKTFELLGLEALSRTVSSIEPQPLIITLDSPEKRDSRTFLYDTGGAFPVHALKVLSQDKNFAVQVRVSSRRSPDAPWNPHLKTAAYRLFVGGLELVNGVESLSSSVNDRYWRIETLDGESTLRTPPTLELQWNAHQIVFMTQAPPPFFVAYGSAAYKGEPYRTDAVSMVSHSLNVSPAAATLGPQQTAGGQSLLVPPTPPPAPRVVEWKKWILWGLLGGVLVVALLMARSLFRELQKG